MEIQTNQLLLGHSTEASMCAKLRATAQCFKSQCITLY